MLRQFVYSYKANNTHRQRFFVSAAPKRRGYIVFLHYNFNILSAIASGY